MAGEDEARKGLAKDWFKDSDRRTELVYCDHG